MYIFIHFSTLVSKVWKKKKTKQNKTKKKKKKKTPFYKKVQNCEGSTIIKKCYL